MSEPITTQDGTQPDAVDQLLLEEERQAYEHAAAGELDAAISGWTAILGDAEKKKFFADAGDEDEPDGPLREIAAGLADAYLRTGDEENRGRAMALVSEYGLQVTAAGEQSSNDGQED